MSLSAAESARRVELYRAGYTFAEIGRQCGVTGQAIFLHLKSIGEFTPRPHWRGRHVPERIARRAVELYERGCSVAHIERVLGVSDTFVYRQLRLAGVPLHNPNISEAKRRSWAAKREAQ